jgi:Leucine-rich repeat (LRR) protein
MMSEDRDHKFSKFIASMRANTLKSLQTIRDIGAGAETFLSLNHHGESLEDLRICVSNDTLPHISLLQGCRALTALRVEDVHGTVDLEATQHDVFVETIAWLRNCHNLKSLSFSKFQSGAAIITPVLLEPGVELSHLEIDSYVLKDHKGLHQALVHQQLHLRELSLAGDTDGMFRDDLDILVDSLKQLTALKRLSLLLPEVLRDEHFIAIIQNLTQLEVLYVSGLELNDIILESIGNLPNLRDVTLSGISKFTVDGLLDFASRLGPGNQGIRVTIDMADPDTMLADESQTVVKDFLFERTGGTLEYMPSRGMRKLCIMFLRLG